MAQSLNKGLRFFIACNIMVEQINEEGIVNHKELRYAFNYLLSTVEDVECSNLHHPTKWQHKDGGVCPAEYHLQRQVYIIKQYMKENRI